MNDKKVFFVPHGETEQIFLKRTFEYYIYRNDCSIYIPSVALTPEERIKVSSTQVSSLEDNIIKTMKYQKEQFVEGIDFIFVIMIDINEQGQCLNLQNKIIAPGSGYVENIIRNTLVEIMVEDEKEFEYELHVKVIYCNKSIENSLGIDMYTANKKGKTKYICKHIKDVSETDQSVSFYDNIRTYLNVERESCNLHELYPFYDSVLK